MTTRTTTPAPVIPGYIEASRLSAYVHLKSRDIISFCKSGDLRHKIEQVGRKQYVYLHAGDLIELSQQLNYRYSRKLRPIANQVGPTAEESAAQYQKALDRLRRKQAKQDRLSRFPGYLLLDKVGDYIPLSKSYIRKQCKLGDISHKTFVEGKTERLYCSISSLLSFCDERGIPLDQDLKKVLMKKCTATQE